MTFPIIHLLPLGVLLAIAAGWDLVRRRIPNAVTLPVAIAGLIIQVVDRGAWAALSGAAAAVIAILVLYRPWQAGGLGGGDVKLAAAVAIWVGMGGLLKYALAVAAAGGAVALITYLLSRKSIRQEVRTNLTLAVLQGDLPPVSPTAPGRPSVPYGLAIVAGAAVALCT